MRKRGSCSVILQAALCVPWHHAVTVISIVGYYCASSGVFFRLLFFFSFVVVCLCKRMMSIVIVVWFESEYSPLQVIQLTSQKHSRY